MEMFIKECIVCQGMYNKMRGEKRKERKRGRGKREEEEEEKKKKRKRRRGGNRELFKRFG
jgi:hypothetical protein